MDLSNSGKTRAFRRALVEKSPAMIGTVPMYDAIGYLEKALIAITPEDFLEVVRAHAEDGVDFVTIHAGMNRRVIESFKETGRLTNIVSRGGSLIFAWMEPPVARTPSTSTTTRCSPSCTSTDVCISIGDAMRPGSGYDATDAGRSPSSSNWQADAPRLGRRSAGDGGRPRHMALDEIAANMKLQQTICMGAPFYVLGPIVTDIAPGYDHITSAIGGASRRPTARPSSVM